MWRVWAALAIACSLFLLAVVSSCGVESAKANPPYKMVEICYEGQTIIVPLWKFKHGDYPGATEGPCPVEPPTEPPPPPPPPEEPEPPTKPKPPRPPCTDCNPPGCRPVIPDCTPKPPPVRCEEDMPCWDCKTMGNKLCGPQAGGIGTPLYVPKYNESLPLTGKTWWEWAIGVTAFALSMVMLFFGIKLRFGTQN